MSGPVALITGAASGIGRQFARDMQQKGYRLALADINIEALQTGFSAGAQVQLYPLDVCRPEQWESVLNQVVGQFGRLDYLFNIAGISRPRFLLDADLRSIDQHLDINAKGTIYGTRLAADILVRQGSGHIINVASLAGITPVPGMSLYSASKFAVRGFSLAVATELKPKGVSVTVVCPDLVDTPMLDYQIHFPESALAFSGSRKVLTPQDLSDALFAVMARKPVEVNLPAGRGWLAKISGSFPRLSNRLLESFRQKGIRHMQDLLRKKGGEI
jgi:3-oxoacyl-[acyl-carrier protein] reductase